MSFEKVVALTLMFGVVHPLVWLLIHKLAALIEHAIQGLVDAD